MGRFATGIFLAPGSSIKVGLTVTTTFNGSGDWGQAYALAHPLGTGAELVSTSHSKVLRSSGRFAYFIAVTNLGPAGTFFAIDF
jgi:hypothetical protein